MGKYYTYFPTCHCTRCNNTRARLDPLGPGPITGGSGMSVYKKEDRRFLIGLCAECQHYPMLLFKVGDMPRYRCTVCYRQETGQIPTWLPSNVSELISRSTPQ